MQLFATLANTNPDICQICLKEGMGQILTPSPHGSTGPLITGQAPSSARRLTPCPAAPESHVRWRAGPRKEGIEKMN